MTFRILLIEDNPSDARLVHMMLQTAEGREFTVEKADRLSAALESLQRSKFDAILLDLGLPDSQGMDTVNSSLKN